MVSPANTYIGLTKPGGEPDEPDKYYPTGERNYARVIVADDKQGQAGAALMQEEGVESVYILDDRETYGKGLADQFQQAAEEQGIRSEEHTSELQSRQYLVCRLLLEKKKNKHRVTI